MKLLPKKQDIDRQKNLELKKEIDSGIALATRIDKLRETKTSEEKALFEWRDNSLKLVQKEIDDYITVRDNLKKQTEEAEVYRKKLIEPLNEEWREINKEKDSLKVQRENTYISSERLKADKEKIKLELVKISDVITRIKKKEDEVVKAKDEAMSLKDMAQKEYEIAKAEHDAQTNTHDQRMSEATERRKEYEVALSLVKIRESEVEQKENQLLLDRKHLESQQAQLRKAIEITKQNGRS